MKKRKIAVLMMAMCLALGGSITAFAETKDFSFRIEKEYYDPGTWLARKADNEQNAYITPTYISGSGRVWAAVYDANGAQQYTYDVAITPGTENVRRVSGYYITGKAGNTYSLIGGDSEWEVTSDIFVASGRWTP